MVSLYLARTHPLFVVWSVLCLARDMREEHHDGRDQGYLRDRGFSPVFPVVNLLYSMSEYSRPLIGLLGRLR